MSSLVFQLIHVLFTTPMFVFARMLLCIQSFFFPRFCAQLSTILRRHLSFFSGTQYSSEPTQLVNNCPWYTCRQHVCVVIIFSDFVCFQYVLFDIWCTHIVCTSRCSARLPSPPQQLLTCFLRRPTETEHTSWSSFDVPCDSHGLFADSPPLRFKRLTSLLSLRMSYRISSRPFASTIQPKSDSLGRCVSTFLQMLLLLVMFPCCLVSPLPLPGSCKTCQTQTVRDVRPAQEAINNCILHLFS